MLILIGGISRAGKSSLAKRLLRCASEMEKTGTIIPQDDFPNPHQRIPKIMERMDWEHPDSLNFGLMEEHVHRAIQRSYDLIIVEGIFAFYDHYFLHNADVKIYIELSYQPFLERRIDDRRWSHTQEPDWYIQHVWNSHFKYGQPPDFNDTIRLNGDKLKWTEKQHEIEHWLLQKLI